MVVPALAKMLSAQAAKPAALKGFRKQQHSFRLAVVAEAAPAVGLPDLADCVRRGSCNPCKPLSNSCLCNSRHQEGSERGWAKGAAG